MRIAVDCRYVRERPSGIGNYVSALVARLPTLSPESRFRLWVDPNAPRPLCGSSRVEETVVAAPANGLRTLLRPSSLGDLDSADVFHAPFNLLGRGIRCATVVTVHDLMWLEHPEWCEALSPLLPFKMAFYRDGLVRALRHATRIVAISEATAGVIAHNWPSASSRLVVIHHGIEPQYRPPQDRAVLERTLAQRFGLVAPYFLVVGQNTPSKNHRAVLRGFARAGLPDGVRLVLLQRLYRGRNGLYDEARRLGIASRVLCLPAVAQDDVLALLQGALSLVQFSRYEGFGMPALEALACGTPVIASDIPALREVLGGAALHASLALDALSRALSRMAREPTLRAELSDAGVERSRRFSWDRSAREHLEAYRDAVAVGPRPS